MKKSKIVTKNKQNTYIKKLLKSPRVFFPIVVLSIVFIFLITLFITQTNILSSSNAYNFAPYFSSIKQGSMEFILLPTVTRIPTQPSISTSPPENTGNKISVEKVCGTVDIMVVGDTTGSIGSELTKSYDFIRRLIKRINVSEKGAHVGVVFFDTVGRLISPLSSNETDLLNKIPVSGVGKNGTSIFQGMKIAKAEMDLNKRGNTRKIFVLITDGGSVDASCVRSSSRCIQNSKSDEPSLNIDPPDYEIITVGIGMGFGTGFATGAGTGLATGIGAGVAVRTRTGTVVGTGAKTVVGTAGIPDQLGLLATNPSYKFYLKSFDELLKAVNDIGNTTCSIEN
ncbi:MAG: VWA domain-containing protein [Candidatus Roizmanbacteria bacterium]